MKETISILIILVSGFFLAFVGPGPAKASETGLAEPLKIAFLPILDALPVHIAQEEGFFEEAGIRVVALGVNSPVERDQLMQAGEINGMLNELSSTALFNQNGVKIQIIRTVRMATENSPVFRILASPQSNITSVRGLSGKTIGISKNSVIEYVTDRLLQNSGLNPDEIHLKSVPVIPERFSLLMSGRIDAATLPDPLAQAAIQSGAIEIINDTVSPGYSISVLSFDIDTIHRRPESLKRFMKAWNKAVKVLNDDPASYRTLFLEKIRVPESIRDTFSIPRFAEQQLPEEKQWDDVLQWLENKGLLTRRPGFTDSVSKDFFSRPDD